MFCSSKKFVCAHVDSTTEGETDSILIEDLSLDTPKKRQSKKEENIHLSKKIRFDSSAEPDHEEQEETKNELNLKFGEKIIFIDTDVVFKCPYEGSAIGTINITNYRLYFKSNLKKLLDVPLCLIKDIEEIEKEINLKCKDIRLLQFEIQENETRIRVLETIRQFAFPIKFNQPIFAFQHGQLKTDDAENGWYIYDQGAEFKRQGIPNKTWKINTINERYELLETFPRKIVTPQAATDDEIKLICKTMGSYPILSWIHPGSQATISRVNRHNGIKTYMKSITLSPKLIIYMMETRQSSDMDAGLEREKSLRNVDLIHLEIDDVTAMEKSLSQLRDVVIPNTDDDQWLSKIEKTRWLTLIKQILKGAVRVTNEVSLESSALILCRDGLDRTAQITCLSMLMLDPYYRTIRGFEVLIEKEWLNFDHNFGQPFVHGEDQHSVDRASVFLQFIDCVWQIMKQLPEAFQYTEKMLITILDSLYSCLYGTFLFNCEKAMVEEQLKDKTVSLWTFVNSHHTDFTNPIYGPVYDVLLPVVRSSSLDLWKTYYCRWNLAVWPKHVR